MKGTGDYISHEAAKKQMRNGRHSVEWLLASGAKTIGDSFEIILDEVPAADVREVKRGKWINDHNGRFSPSGDNYFCSVCGDPALRVFGHPAKTNFCPNCGADMREES